MRRKTIVGVIAIVAIVATVILCGCIDEITQLTPSPTATPELNEERELMKQWYQMYGEELEEDDLDWFMDELKRANIHPVEIYRGSMIFYEKSYGYIYIGELDGGFKGYPRDMTDTKIMDLAIEKGGTNTGIYLFDQEMWCICFPTLNEAENFLAELWSIS